MIGAGGIAFEKVLRRVAGQDQFRQDCQAAAPVAGFADAFHDFPAIGREIADDRVDLYQGYFHLWLFS
jgi:hypothetical protein